MITTIEELRAYLDQMLVRAAAYNTPANIESMCARMWKEFTPHALSFWTTSGVLEHIAAVLSPPAEDDDEEDDDTDPPEAA